MLGEALFGGHEREAGGTRTRSLAEGKAGSLQGERGTWQSIELDESLQKTPEVCCRKVSGSDHPILLGLFYPARFQVAEGIGVYSRYFSSITLPFGGLARTALRARIKVFKKHLSLLKLSCFAILLFCSSFIILCKRAVCSLLRRGLQRDGSPSEKIYYQPLPLEIINCK